jgi:O-antigen ligase
MLMSAGVVLAIGLLAAKRKAESGESGNGNFFLRSLRSFAVRLVGERSRPGCRSTRPASNTGNANDEVSLATRGARVVPILLFIAALMMGVGLFFSYSRGAWVGTAIGLLYLAKVHGKLKWRWVLPPVLVALMVICFFWNNTSDSVPWYLKRLDLSRPSAQHRVSAWRGAVQMMWDHPLGVGWNNSVKIYAENYSSPEGGAAALTMNSYLVLGTELGLPGLVCFVAYVALCLGAPASRRQVRSKAEPAGETPALPAIKMACRAGALAMLVAFWFDGGLFKLATASVFWILLELGSAKSGKLNVHDKGTTTIFRRVGVRSSTERSRRTLF